MYILFTAPQEVSDSVLDAMMATTQQAVEEATPEGTVVIADAIRVTKRQKSRHDYANNDAVHGVLFHGDNLLSKDKVQAVLNKATGVYDGWRLILKDAPGTWSANGVKV